MLHLCPMKMFSILVLDLVIENQSLWARMQRFARPGAEGIKEDTEQKPEI